MGQLGHTGASGARTRSNLVHRGFMHCKDRPDFLLQRQGGAVELNASGDPLLYSFSTHAASMSLFADVALSYSCKLSLYLL